MPIGMEWAGEVVALGEDVDSWSVGDRVMGMGGNAFAEFKVAPTKGIFAVPDGLRWREAAALPDGMQVMHDALVTQGLFEPGQSVLFQGASSGMGLMGMQIAQELGASKIIGTSTSAERRARLPEFGADLVLDSQSNSWVEEVLEATDGAGVDLVLDMIAGPTVSDSMRALRIGGRMVNIGRVAGETSEVDLDLHSMRRITYVGTTFRTRTHDQVIDVVDAAHTALAAALKDHRLSMPVEHVFRLEDALPAFDVMAENRHFGKIVIEVSAT